MQLQKGGGSANQVFWRIARWVPAVGWMAVIYQLSALPGSDLPGRYSTLAHFVSYAVLGALVLLALGSRRPAGERVAIAVVVASLYAMTDEFHQSFVPMRTPDVADWGIDTLGAWFGAWSALTLGRAVQRLRRRRQNPPEVERTP